MGVPAVPLRWKAGRWALRHDLAAPGAVVSFPDAVGRGCAPYPVILKRHLLVVGSFLLAVLLYVDRVCISAAKGPVSEALQLTDEQFGWVLSSFALGYALFQTPGGMLADRLGPRRVLTGVVIAWSLFTGLTGLVGNFASMLAVRFLFGACEAGGYPGIARAAYSWIPMKERSLVTGIYFSGGRLGAAFALPGIAWLIGRIGWRESFCVLMVVGFVWATAWWLWFRDDPAEHAGIPTAERDFILANRQPAGAGGSAARLGFGTMLRSRNLQLAMAQYFCSNFTFFFCLTWLFPHLKRTYNLDAVSAGWYASAPLMAGAAGNVFAGWIADGVYRAGRWKLSRQLPAVAGFFLAAVGLLASTRMDSPFGAVAWLSVAIFGADMTLAPSWSFCMDIGRGNAGAVSGTMNMAGNLGSFVTSLAFPYLLKWTGEPDVFFYGGAALNLIAAVLWLMMKPERKIEEY
jgi:ACS family glucarate transporter-like MFS transporter